MQPGLFDLEFGLDKIDANGDPLKKLNDMLDWEIFRRDLEAAHHMDKDRKFPAGRKPYDAVRMFKILILQSLYGLSDDTTEYQILDRLVVHALPRAEAGRGDSRRQNDLAVFAIN